MANKAILIIVVVIALMLIGATTTSIIPAPLAGTAWASIFSFPSACPTGQFVSAVGITLTCSTPGGGAPSENSACAADKFAISVLDGVLTCSFVGWTQITGKPSKFPPLEDASCSTGNYLSSVIDGLAGCTQDQPFWSLIQNFPAACAVGSYVRKIDITPTCSSSGLPVTARATSDVVWQSTMSAPTVTQVTAGGCSSCTQTTVTFASNVAGSSLLIACGTANVGSISTPTDTLGLTWTLITGNANGVSAATACHRARVGAGGAESITCKAGSSGSLGCSIFEIAGATTFNIRALTATGTSASPAVASTSYTNQPLLIAAVASTTSCVSWTAGASFTKTDTGQTCEDTQYSTTKTSPSTFPVTLGASVAWAETAVIIYRALSSTLSFNLAANTNYFAVFYLDLAIASSGTINLNISPIASDATVQMICGQDPSQSLNRCFTSTDAVIFNGASGSSIDQPHIVTVTILTGSTATTLTLNLSNPNEPTGTATVRGGSTALLYSGV